MDTSNLIQRALELGAFGAAVIPVCGIAFRREFRLACEQNTCGKYGQCWMCPPDVGDIDEMIERAKTYHKALVFQSRGRLEDSFDIEGMEAAARAHNQLSLRLAEQLSPLLRQSLMLGAGACQVCGRCARPDGEPCRHPNLAMASLESYGIAVSELAASCGMDYIGEAGTVTYFGVLLFREPPATL